MIWHDRLKDVSTVPIILASSSPRRRELLSGLGLNFKVVPADIDEERYKAATPPLLVEHLAQEKARAVAHNYPDALIIAADTLVVSDGQILSKPKSLDENKQFIRQLAGTVHEVYTGHALMFQAQETSAVVCTRVRFRALSDGEIDRFVATGEGLDKAGGYAIQGRGAAFIDWIEGCYFNVVGLSLATVTAQAAKLGVNLV
jgi:septum formation protein